MRIAYDRLFDVVCDVCGTQGGLCEVSWTLTTECLYQPHSKRKTFKSLGLDSIEYHRSKKKLDGRLEPTATCPFLQPVNLESTMCTTQQYERNHLTIDNVKCNVY